MANGMFDVECPCCEAKLKIDPETRAVIAHTVHEKPRAIDDLAAEVEKLKGAGARFVPGEEAVPSTDLRERQGGQSAR